MHRFKITLEAQAPDREVLVDNLRNLRGIVEAHVVEHSCCNDVPAPAGSSNGHQATTPTRPQATRSWWLDQAQIDADKVLEKAGEYSAYDLELMGSVMTDWHKLPPNIGMEAACLFYVLGKVCRAIGAYKEGLTPSDDTLLDICQYTMMARRIRETGCWP